MKNTLLAFVAGLVVMAGAVYVWIHKNPDVMLPIDEPSPHNEPGIFHKRKTIAVGEVVNGIRKLNRLVVFQSYLTATTTTRDEGWVTESKQTMLTPAFVNYYVDMGDLNSSQIKIQGNDIYIARPAVIIERPNIDTRNIQTFNEGVWSNLTSNADRMRVANNQMALRQLVQRAKMPFLVEAATRGAEAAIANNIRAVLVSIGHPEMVVHVSGAK